MTIQAGFALIGVALTTGLIFAKASRARAAILFTNSILFAKRNGRDALTMRLGNARGSEIADMNMTMTVVMDEVSQEGTHMRRLYDLDLVRSRTPLFRLSWTVMHEIDENSPIHGLSFEELETKVWAIICTCIGHDGVYGQTVYARKIYYPESIVANAQFVDILSQTHDGRIVVDFDRFHEVQSTSS